MVVLCGVHMHLAIHVIGQTSPPPSSMVYLVYGSYDLEPLSWASSWSCSSLTQLQLHTTWVSLGAPVSLDPPPSPLQPRAFLTAAAWERPRWSCGHGQALTQASSHTILFIRCLLDEEVMSVRTGPPRCKLLVIVL